MQRNTGRIYSRKTIIKTVLISLFSIVTFTTLNCCVSSQTLFIDEFDGETLDSNWYWANEPDEWDIGQTRRGWLSITGRLDSNIFCSDETTRLYQIVEEDIDFDVSTRMYCEWGNNVSDVAGLIVKFPSVDDWIDIKLWMHQDGTAQLELQKKCNDIISPVPGYSPSGGSEELYIRLVKRGNDYTGYYKAVESDDWTTIGTVEGFNSLPMQIGLFGGVDSGSGNLLIQFDFFHN